MNTEDVVFEIPFLQNIFLFQEPPRSSHNGILRGYYVAWRYAGATSVEFRRQKVTPATKRKLQLSNLILNSPYEVKVQMFNDAGAGPYSDPLRVKTKEGGKYRCYDIHASSKYKQFLV